MAEQEGSRASYKSLAELLVLVPFLHLFATGLFLMGYHMGFGFRLYVFASSGDIFSASIGNVGRNYIAALIPPILFILWSRGQSGAWTIHEAALSKPAGEERERAFARAASDRRFFGVLFGLLVAGQTIAMALQYYRWGYISYAFIGFLVILAYCTFIIWYSNRVGMASFIIHAVNLIGMMLISSLFNGLASGQIDRRMKYSDAVKAAVTCPQGAILRSVGTHLIVVSRSNTHLITDEDCKVVGSLAG